MSEYAVNFFNTAEDCILFNLIDGLTDDVNQMQLYRHRAFYKGLTAKSKIAVSNFLNDSISNLTFSMENVNRAAIIAKFTKTSTYHELLKEVQVNLQKLPEYSLHELILCEEMQPYIASYYREDDPTGRLYSYFKGNVFEPLVMSGISLSLLLSDTRVLQTFADLYKLNVATQTMESLLHRYKHVKHVTESDTALALLVYSYYQAVKVDADVDVRSLLLQLARNKITMNEVILYGNS